MRFFRQALKHPQRLWIRRLNFQVHLWAGIILALYLIVMGVTGSILVFGVELTRLVEPSPWPRITSISPPAHLNTIIDHIRFLYPHTHVISLMAPTQADPVFTAFLQKRVPLKVACHPITGQVLGEIHRAPHRLSWIYDLHENLLARRPGRIVNGIASASLLLLALTGLINWWPGVRSWPRAVRVDFRRKWKRINFDLHSAVGFWSFAFLVLWAVTGIYFTWPDKIAAAVGRISPLANSSPPAIVIDANTEPVKLDFDAMLQTAHQMNDSEQFEGIIFPSGRRSPLEILMLSSPRLTRDHESTLYFNPYTGRYIVTWRYGLNRTLGDWIVWLQIPLHFGTHWGLAVKIVWAALGLALPVLSVTGLLMYWNRVLGKTWNRLRSP